MHTAVTRDSAEPQTRPRSGFSLRQGEIALVLVGLMFLLVQLVIVRIRSGFLRMNQTISPRWIRGSQSCTGHSRGRGEWRCSRLRCGILT